MEVGGGGVALRAGRLDLGQRPVHRRPAHLEAGGDLLGADAAGGQQLRMPLLISGQRRRPATEPPSRPGGCEPGLGAFDQQVPLHGGQRR